MVIEKIILKAGTVVSHLASSESLKAAWCMDSFFKLGFLWAGDQQSILLSCPLAPPP